MTYILFLFLFVCLPLVGLGLALRGSLRRQHLTMLIVLATIAVVYTTPWDNYLVATRVWYYNPQLVLNVLLGYVPIEEYAFFILQTFLVGLFALWLWRRYYPADFAEKSGL
jgi:lycopene cyclase domain-containing protein